MCRTCSARGCALTAKTFRVLMTADAVGGVWHYATGLAAGLARHGHEVLLAIAGPPPSSEKLAALERAAGVVLLPTALPLDWMSDPASVRQAGRTLAEIARRERVDLVHLNSPALAAAGPIGVPLVVVGHGCVATWWEAARHGPLPDAFQWHAEAMGRGLRAADLVVAPSACHAEILRRHYALLTAPAVVHNGRDIALPPTPDELDPSVLTVGRLWDPVKNAALLDQVAATLSVPFTAAGALVGPRGERIELRHLQTLGEIGDSELASRLARRPVFVSAASFEPFGLAVLEAARAGCALVLSDIRTFRELWDGAAAFIAGEAADYADAIERIFADPVRRRRLGEAARARSASYTGERMVAAMAGHYAALLARRQAA